MNALIIRKQKYRSPPPQPLDRHLSEIAESDGSIYINAGIDSTCCKKRSRTIHKLTNGIVVSTDVSPTKTRSSNGHNDDILPIMLNSSTHDDRCDSINNGGGCIHCAYCGK
ncbi:unnamed protein product [Adineta steineri]|uniref:Uncharacterized protein n=1 Tax=Adineta steineri TaxID=433720 RepID=A0A818Q1K2_9BILA|nr:unnamed protein product [Adineta steineri]CAF3634210.1 unnamed protein product [Adineta steineri]